MGVGIGFANFCMYIHIIFHRYGSQIISHDPSFDRGFIFTVSGNSRNKKWGNRLFNLSIIDLRRIKPVLKIFYIQKPIIDPYSTKGIVLSKMKGDITLENVHFSYPSRKDIPILKGVSLHVAADILSYFLYETLSIERLDFYVNNITIDGINLCDVNVQSLREQIGIVSQKELMAEIWKTESFIQEPILFDGTLYDNIKMGNENSTYEEIMEACQKVSSILIDFILLIFLRTRIEALYLVDKIFCYINMHK
uniref:ABC transporter domain-containing protein n=1 Tax=Heterorhabditis bacteriophora TaxID=37862 RepID=A0A1I7WYK3_HETBA